VPEQATEPDGHAANQQAPAASKEDGHEAVIEMERFHSAKTGELERFYSTKSELSSQSPGPVKQLQTPSMVGPDAMTGLYGDP
jgi:hypothetical protein